MRRRMAFAALAARRAIATSSRIADIPRPSMAVHTRQLFGAVRMLSPSGSSHRREAALGLGAKRFLSSPGEGEFEDAVARSKSISNPVRYLGPESPKIFPLSGGFFCSELRFSCRCPQSLSGSFHHQSCSRPCPGQRHAPLALRSLQAGKPRPL